MGNRGGLQLPRAWKLVFIDLTREGVVSFREGLCVWDLVLVCSWRIACVNLPFRLASRLVFDAFKIQYFSAAPQFSGVHSMLRMSYVATNA